jgi:Tfp pilus assembly protein PilO
MTMSDRDKKLLAALVPIVVLAAYWFLLLSPKREEATTASTTLTEQQERLDAARAASQSASGAEEGFEASYAQIVRLGKAIPSTVDMPSLLVQLDAAAAGTGISFTRISAGERVQAPAPATPPAESTDEGTPAAAAGGEPAQSAPGTATEAANEAEATSDDRNAAAEQSGVDAQTSTSTGEGGLPVGGGDAGSAAPAGSPAPAGLETIPLELEFTGNFFNLADFFHRVKRFVRLANQDVLVSGRLITVEGVNWTSDAEIFPRMRAQLNATVYLSPKSEGVTAGATPSGPAPTPAAGGTPAPAEPAPEAAPAPTATVTR